MAPFPEENAPHLPAGTQLGVWRVEAWQGQGTYGAVYRAVPVGQEPAAPVALKLSLFPDDARFGREVELLARLSHPSIPRLLGSGVLCLPSGAQHRWFVMEWVEGRPLYTWAEQHAPSYGQLCQLLAQLARALEALHAAGAVHRDVKGANVLVRLSGRLPVLIDFGSSHFQGATRLTWRSLAPFTPAYLSAQGCLFHIRCARERDGYYAPTPADDLYALGVTAYRLVMGEYPPSLDIREDEQGGWHVSSPDPRPLLEQAPRVQPLLREWILRLLSDVPETRGTAAELAEALEAEAREHVEKLQPVAVPAAEVSVPDAARKWAVRPWLALAAVALFAVILCPSQQPMPVSPDQVSASLPEAEHADAPDAGTAATGDREPNKRPASTPPAEERELPSPKQPRSQTQPDAKGRCPVSVQVAFNGGCWVELPSMTTEACVKSGYEVFNGKCYAPALEVPQKAVPTSSPVKER